MLLELGVVMDRVCYESDVLARCSDEGNVVFSTTDNVFKAYCLRQEFGSKGRLGFDI